MLVKVSHVLCQIYIIYIYILYIYYIYSMWSTYHVVLTIHSYINIGRDVDFWLDVKGALCNFYSHLILHSNEFMLSSTSRFQTTASGISPDSRSYDNNMSSNTTSSTFVSDDEVCYFKQTKVQCRFSNLPGK